MSIRKVLGRAALLASAVTASPAVAADTFSATVFFGDSLTDAGFFRPLLPASAQPVIGQFTTNPGDVYAEILADYYGTNRDPNGNGQVGDNYAAGGAQVTVNVVSGLGPIPSLSAQIASYLATNGGKADPDALFTVYGGANDIFTITNGGANPLVVLPATIAGEVANVQTLTTAGARYILVPNLPDIGATPAFRAQGALAQATGTALSSQYNTGLYAALETAGLRFIPLDTFTLLREVLANPGLYGFTNFTGTACQPQITANSLTCNPSSLITPTAARDYVFADGVHPTTATHLLTAQYAISVLEAPRLIQQLGRTAATVGRSRSDRIIQHVVNGDVDGLRWWANGRLDVQSDRYIDNRGPAALLGLDYAMGDLTVGAFAGFGRTRYKFGGNAGRVSQRDLTAGLFAGWSSDIAFVNGQLSYTGLDYKVDRRVQLLTAERAHDGSPNGRNLSAAIEAGARFNLGKLKAGPIVGLVMQNVRVDGYAESNGELATALAYPKQKYRSLIGTFGGEASYDVGEGAMPYLRATYDREFKDVEKEAFASLQTLDTPAYAVPGIEIDRSYATVTGGVKTVFGGFDANVGASINFGRKDGQDIAGFLTVGRKF